MAKLRTGGGLVDCDLYLRTPSGLVQVGPQFRTATGLVDCGSATALSVVADPDSVFGAQSADHPVVVYTNTTSITVTGGRAPYVYAWSSVPGWTVANPTSSQTAFSSAVGSGSTDEATFTCTVTDARGSTATATVSAQVSNFGRNDGLVP